MSDTFSKHKQIIEGADSAKANAPITYSNESSENYMMEDSMNVAMDDHKDPIYDEYHKLQYQFYKLKSAHKQMKHQLQEAQIKVKELQLCSSYFEEMYLREKQDKKNAEIAFKRILNKMYQDDRYTESKLHWVVGVCNETDIDRFWFRVLITSGRCQT